MIDPEEIVRRRRETDVDEEEALWPNLSDKGRAAIRECRRQLQIQQLNQEEDDLG